MAKFITDAINYFQQHSLSLSLSLSLSPTILASPHNFLLSI